MPTDQIVAAFRAQRFCVATDAHREALAQLTDGLGARETFLLVTGDPGTGKTALVREAASAWGARAAVAFITNPALARTELIEDITRRLGGEPPSGGTKPQLLAALERACAEVAAQGKVPVLVVDDAHALAPELLEELLLLSNSEAQQQRPLEIVLAGLPSLDARLDEPAFTTIRQRIAARCHLAPLSHKGARRYIDQRLGEAGDDARLFPRDTVREIHGLTGGVPRAINSLAIEALRQMRERKAEAVAPEHVRAAAKVLGWAAPAVASATATAVPAPAAAATASAAPTSSASTPAPPTRARGVTSAAPAAGEDAMSVAVTPSPAVPAERAAPPVPASPAAPAAPETSVESPPRSSPAAAAKPGVPARTMSDFEADPPVIRTEPHEVSEWVSRFIGDQGPPRIGALAACASLGPMEDEVIEDPEAQASEAAPKRAARRVRGRVLRRRRSRGVVKSAVVLVAIVAVLLLIAAIMEPGIRRRITAGTAIDDTASTVVPAAALPPAAPPIPARIRARASKPAPVVTAPAPAITSRAAVAPGAAGQAPVSTPGAATPPPRSQRLALDVATYLEADRAAAERDRIVAESGLKGWIVTRNDGGVEEYAIVLGIFSTPERAEAAGSVLMSRGLVTQARIVPLPPKSDRE